MRRCLHAFFTGLLTFSLVTAPAHACWRSRQARHYRAVPVLTACPPPVGSECSEPCDSAAFWEVLEVEVASDCCPSLPVAADCCGEAVVVAESHVEVDEVIGWAEESGVSLAESHSAHAAVAEPTLAAAPNVPPSLESIAAPPALEQAGGVTRASNDEPLTESRLVPERPAPAAESVLAESAIRDDVESQEDVVAADPAAPTPAEPPMETEPEVADAGVEPQPAVEEQPEVPVEPASQEPNIFEELDAREAPIPPAGEEEMTETEAADPFAVDSPEPAAPSDASPAPDQDSEPAAADPFTAAERPRRWIDVTGTGSIVATLVSVAGHDHCVLETRGRRVVVPLENLSRHDRDYVRRADARLATHGWQAPEGKAAVPAPAALDTAGL